MIYFITCPIALGGNCFSLPGCLRYGAAHVPVEQRLGTVYSLNISMGFVYSFVVQVLVAQHQPFLTGGS